MLWLLSAGVLFCCKLEEEDEEETLQPSVEQVGQAAAAAARTLMPEEVEGCSTQLSRPVPKKVERPQAGIAAWCRSRIAQAAFAAAAAAAASTQPGSTGKPSTERTDRSFVNFRRDAFSGYKIYPGRGRLYVRQDSKVFRFVSSKEESLFLQRKNPRKLAWTQIYRRVNRKGVSEEVAKKRSRRTVKHQRGVAGLTMEQINARRSGFPRCCFARLGNPATCQLMLLHHRPPQPRSPKSELQHARLPSPPARRRRRPPRQRRLPTRWVKPMDHLRTSCELQADAPHPLTAQGTFCLCAQARQEPDEGRWKEVDVPHDSRFCLAGLAAFHAGVQDIYHCCLSDSLCLLSLYLYSLAATQPDSTGICTLAPAANVLRWCLRLEEARYGTTTALSLYF